MFKSSKMNQIKTNTKNLSLPLSLVKAWADCKEKKSKQEHTFPLFIYE